MPFQASRRATCALYAGWALAVVLFACVFVVLTWRVEPGQRIIQGVDGISYSLWVRSMVLDGNLDFADEIDRVHAGQLPGGELETATGLRPNKYGIGVSVLATPAFLVARAVDRARGAEGVEFEAGWTRLDRTALALAALFWGWLGLVLTHRFVRRFASPAASALSVTVLLVGSNLLYYFVREPFQAHLDSLFACSLGLLLTVRARERGLAAWGWALAGAAVGFSASVRFTNALMFVVPAALLWRQVRVMGPSSRVASGRAATALVLGALLGFLPQALAWKQVYGSWLVYTYDVEAFVYASSPKLLEVLFSSRHGLLSWSPILLVALAGWPRVVARLGDTAHAVALWALLLLFTIASWEQWWLGHSFGHRGFLCLFPVFCVALACLWDGLEDARARRRVLGLLAACIAWNGMLMLAFLSEMIPYSGTFSWWDYITSLPDLPGHVLSKMRGG